MPPDLFHKPNEWSTMSIRLFSLCLLGTLLVAAAPPVAASDLQDEWRNTNNTVHLRVKPCGEALCGTVTWATEEQRASARKGSGKDLVGSVLLRDLKRASDGSWRGKVFLPAINANASATLTQVNPQMLRVSGCTLLGLACKSQHWHRIR